MFSMVRKGLGQSMSESNVRLDPLARMLPQLPPLRHFPAITWKARRRTLRLLRKIRNARNADRGLNETGSSCSSSRELLPLGQHDMTAEQAAENIKAKIDELATDAGDRMDALADVVGDPRRRADRP